MTDNAEEPAPAPPADVTMTSSSPTPADVVVVKAEVADDDQNGPEPEVDQRPTSGDGAVDEGAPPPGTAGSSSIKDRVDEALDGDLNRVGDLYPTYFANAAAAATAAALIRNRLENSEVPVVFNSEFNLERC